MEVYVQQFPDHRQIALCSTTHALIFESMGEKRQSNAPSCSMQLQPKEFVTNNIASPSQKGEKFFQKLSFRDIHGFVGLIEVEKFIFIVCITGKTKVAQPVPGESVNKIFSVDFFCLNDSRWDFIEIDSNGYSIVEEYENGGSASSSSSSRRSDPYAQNTMYDSNAYEVSASISSSSSSSSTGDLGKHPAHDLRKLLSNGSFYYSSDFDLTSSLQNRGGLKNKHSLSMDNFEEEYMWNSFLMQEVVSFRDRLSNEEKEILDEQGFLTTVIRGFAETFISYIKELKCSMTVISKQSWKRAGTRYNARGIDDEGDVANFVETEFIMYSREFCFAFVEVRGSVPIFWEQDTSLINPKVSVTRSVDATQPIFDNHFKKLCSKYGPVNIVNLLSTKSSEIELTKRYRTHYDKSKLRDDVFMTEFDFHKQTASEGFSASVRIKPLIENFLLDSGYYSYDVVENKILSEQHGVFRVNCLDCLDRTNLIQQFLSNLTFKLFLSDFKLLTGTKASMFDDETDLFVKHNSLWADNGDQISQIYTGTNALKSSFSRKGKMSFAGALSDATKSVSRIYINNFMDKDKQNVIDKLLGKLPNQLAVQLYDPMMDYVSSKLLTSSEQYSNAELVNIFIGTYNVNGITRKADLSKWLFPIGDKFKPDIVVLGLQEVIELTAGSILNADYSKSSLWEKMVNDCLNQFGESDKYIMLRTEQMTSLLILFFVRSDKINNIKQVEGGSKKTGFGGITGNKGAVAIRFNYGETSFCFINSHLAAGSTAVEERKLDYQNIMKGVKFSRGRSIDIHDKIFWLGDLNYRVELPNLEVRRALNNESGDRYEKLLHFDQLTNQINAGAVFKGFKEPTIKFAPTYKYDLGTNMYDTSEKARTPSWTDRILYKGLDVRPLSYSDVGLSYSDHKPVYAAYRSKVLFVDEGKKEAFVNQYKNEWKMQNNVPKSSIPSSLNPSFEGQSPIELPKPRKRVPQSSEISLLDLDSSSLSSSASISSERDTLSTSNTSATKAPLVPNKPTNLSLTSNNSDVGKTTETEVSKKPLGTFAQHSAVPPPPPPAPRRQPATPTVPSSPSPVMVSLPPGFDQGLTLKAKDGRVKESSTNLSFTNLSSVEKKEAPLKPAKKPELSVDSWTPLTPK